MDKMLYVAMSGAKMAMEAQQLNTHNLANASTTGFRSDLEMYQSMPLQGETYPTRVYPSMKQSAINFQQGMTMNTGRELDIAVNGDGWIAIQGSDGREAYSRSGDLRVTAEGLLKTGAGYPVIGEGGPIAIPPADKIDIANDGTISIVPVGQTSSSLAIIDRIKLVNPDSSQLKKTEEGLLSLKNGGDAEADAAVTVTSGALESSNVNPIESMVEMLSLQRNYELQIKMMATAKENDKASSKLLVMN